MKHKIFVIGSCNTDMVVRSERIPALGETILGGRFMMNPGGKGANQAVAAARLGGNTTLVARVGNDMFGSKSVELYKKDGIDTSAIVIDDKAPSGVALIMVDAKGENCISVAKSANDELSVEQVKAIENKMNKDDILVVQLEIPQETVDYAVRVAHERGLRVILNPAPARTLPSSIYSVLYMIVPNETEASLLTGVEVIDTDSAKAAAAILSSRGVKTVVITMGRQGALVYEDGACELVPAFKVKAADTTAAGDTFCGAVAVALSEGRSVREAVLFGNRASSIAVTRLGAQASVPTRAEVDEASKA